MQADAFQAQLMSGSLRLDVAKLISNGVLEWMDTLRPAQARPTEAQEVSSQQPGVWGHPALSGGPVPHRATTNRSTSTAVPYHVCLPGPEAAAAAVVLVHPVCIATDSVSCVCGCVHYVPVAAGRGASLRAV